MHILPRSYLDRFADSERHVICHFADGRPARRLATRNVGVRRNFYAYQRASGVRSAAVEEMMRPLESAAIPVIRRVAQDWPLSAEDRGTLSEFLALQLVRTPAWQAFYVNLRESALAGQRRDARHAMSGEEWELFEEHMRGDAQRFLAMFRQPPKVGTLLASMHWTLLRFGSDRLITSDQPVVPFADLTEGNPFEVVARRGLAHVPEFRFPLSPRCAVLMCWADRRQDADLRGSPAQARTINHSVKAQADRHWFSRPGTSPSHGFGSPEPLTYGLLSEYGRGRMDESVRRRRAMEIVQRWIDSQTDVREINIVGFGDRSR
jgi:hypothetical protein